MLMIEFSQIPPEYFKSGETKEASVLRYLGAFFRRLEEVSDGALVLIRFSTKVNAPPLTRPSNFAQQLSKLTLGQAKNIFLVLRESPIKIIRFGAMLWC